VKWVDNLFFLILGGSISSLAWAREPLLLHGIDRSTEKRNGKLYGGRVVRHRNGTDSLGNRHRIEELSGVTHP
jgi:hypothetical protein